MPEASRRRSRLRKILWRGALVLGVLLAGAYLFRIPLLAPVLRDALTDVLRSELGLETEVGEIGGSFVGSLTLRELRTLGATEGQPVQQLDVGLVKARYSLLALALGHEDWLRRVELRDVQVELAESSTDGPAEPPGEAPVWPGHLPEIEIRNLGVRMDGGDFGIHLAGLDLVGDMQSADRFHLEWRAALQHLEWRDRRWEDLPLWGVLDYRNGLIEIPAVRVGGVDRLRDARVDLRGLSEDRFDASGTLAAFGGTAAVDARLERRLLTAELELTEIRTREVLELLSQGDLPGLLSLEAELQLPLDDPTRAEGRLVAELSRAEVGPLPIATLELEATVAEGRAEIRYVDAYGEELVVRGRGIAFPLDFEGDILRLAENWSGELAIETRDLGRLAQRFGVELERPAGPLPPGLALDLAARVEGTTLRLDEADLRTSSGSLTVSDARLEFARAEDSERSMTAELPLEFRLTDPELLPLDWKPPKAEGRARLTARMQVPAGRALAAEDVRSARVEGLRLAGEGFELTGSGDWSDSRAAGELELRSPDLSALLTRLGLAGSVPASAGRSTVALSFEGDLDAPLGVLTWELDEVACAPDLYALPAPLAARGELHYADGGFELARAVFSGEGLELEGRGNYALALEPRALLAGELPDWEQPFQGELEASVVELQRWTAEGSGLPHLQGAFAARFQARGTPSAPGVEGTLDWTDGGWSDASEEVRVARLTAAVSGALDAAGAHAAVELTALEGEARGKPFQLEQPAQLSYDPGGRLRVAGLSMAAFGGRFELAADLDPRLDRAEPATLSLQARELRLTEAGIWNADLELERTAGEIRISKLELSGPETVFSAEGSLPAPQPGGPLAMGEGPLDLRGRLAASLSGATGELLPQLPFTSGRLSGDWSLAGTFAAPEIQLSLEATDWQASSEEAGALGPQTFGGTLVAHYADGAVTVEQFDASSEQLQVRAGGRWPLNLGSGAWRGEAPLLPDEAVAADLRADAEDLAWLAKSMPGLRHAGGALQAELQIAGTARAPELRGEVLLRDASVRQSEPGAPLLEKMNGRLVFEGEQLEVEELRGEIGGAPFRVSGTAALAAGQPMDLRVEGTDVLLFRQDGIRLRANADVRLSGPLEDLLVAGRIEITNGWFSKRLEIFNLLDDKAPTPEAPKGLVLFSFPEPPLKDLRFDVFIESTEGAIQVRNNVLEGPVRPFLHLGGTGEVPIIDGRIIVTQFIVDLPSSPLRIERGYVEFPKDDPFFPRLFFSGRTYPRGYDVAVRVIGRYDQPTIFMSSTPPLPQDELFLLVLSGVPPKEEGESATGIKAWGQTAIYLGEQVLSEFTGGEPDESTVDFLRRFEMESRRDPTYRYGSRTYQGRFRFLDNSFTEDDHLYLIGERDAFEDFNLGVKILFKF